MSRNVLFQLKKKFQKKKWKAALATVKIVSRMVTATINFVVYAFNGHSSNSMNVWYVAKDLRN